NFSAAVPERPRRPSDRLGDHVAADEADLRLLPGREADVDHPRPADPGPPAGELPAAIDAGGAQGPEPPRPRGAGDLAGVAAAENVEGADVEGAVAGVVLEEDLRAAPLAHR